MSRFDRKTQLEASGFEHASSLPVAIPYQLWHATLLIEYDRKFRLAEEIVLKLIGTGVTDQKQLAQLLGLETDEAFRQILVDLLRGTYIRYRLEQLELTSLGQQAVINLTARAQKRFNDAQLLYDAYTDKFTWYGEVKLLSSDNVRAGGLNVLPDTTLLDGAGVATRYGDIQKLIEREGVLNDPQPDRKKDLLLVEPVWSEPVYKRAEMEVWLNKNASSVDWRLLQGDLELFDETKAYRILEAEGVRVIPKSTLSPHGLSINS